MGQIGFDNDKYLAMQSAHIRERISKFGGKLYLEFGGKLFDDFHASRVLPGFQPDSKIRMLQQLRDDAEIVIAVNANDIEKNKVRGDLGITYDDDCLRLIDAFRSLGLYVGGVCITQYAGQNAADAFIKRLNTLGVRNYRHYPIAGYPSDVAHIVSDEGFGHNEYIETTHSLIVVTAPGPGSGKMATCLSQLYHEHKHGVSAGYAKFETFPIWNLPLKHPVNLAYEAATADLDDVNMIDPFHLEAYGETTVNYNRDVEIFPVLRAIFERISGKCPYQSPTDMGVNMAGNCIIDDEVCRQASRMEILRRYYTAQVDVARGIADACQLRKLELVMQQADVTPDLCPAVAAAKQKAEETGAPAGAMVLPDGRLACYYSDATDEPNHSQKLVMKISEDGVNWGDVIDIVALSDQRKRPGMATIVQLNDGRFMMTYEMCDAEDPGCGNPITYRFSDDGISWGDPKDPGIKVVTDTGAVPGSAPYLAYLPNVGDNGLLLMTAVFQTPSQKKGNIVYYNDNMGAEDSWKTWYLPQNYRIPDGGYSRAIFTAMDVQTAYFVNNIPDANSEEGYYKMIFVRYRFDESFITS